jgi:uncharacterized RDD family membrane protein YckC
VSAAADAGLEYVGFWPRVGAALIDTLWVTPIVVLLGLLLPSSDTALLEQMLRDPAQVSTSALAASVTPSLSELVVNYVVPAVLVVLFWFARSATPGKMVIGARIVDARSGNVPSRRQLVIRYLGYFVSMLPLFLGLMWVGWDPRKQGWHDKLAGTVVVRPVERRTAAVSFPNRGAR